VAQLHEGYDDDDDKKRSYDVVMIRFMRRSSVVVPKCILEFHITTAVLCHGLRNFIMRWKGWSGGTDRSTQFELAVVTLTRHDFTTHTNSGFRPST